MIFLESYLKNIQEKKVFTKNSNAPCAAYETVYEKKCPNRRGKNPDHKQKLWNGMNVDINLKDKWLKDLNNIKGIEIRSSCEGHDKEWVAFVIFRFLESSISNNKTLVERVVSNIEASDKITKCSGHIGSGGKMRFIVAAPTWYGHKDWEQWWNSLSTRIKNSLK